MLKVKGQMSRRAFTLIETMVTIVIFALLMGTLTGFMMWGYRQHGYVWQQSQAIDEAQRGVRTMVREIREARSGDDGSYPIELANEKEFVFFSDIDKDGETERVRYFLGSSGSGSDSKDCVAFATGGSCQVTFSDFLSGTLTTATIQVSVEGDFSWSNKEYATISVDGVALGDVCRTGCNDCAATWQGTTAYDVTGHAADNLIVFTADATDKVNGFCDWEEENHAMKALFELTWQEEVSSEEHRFKKGVTNPTGTPPQYVAENEEITVLSMYVRNAPPIFQYFDENGNEITELPARLIDTRLMKVYLVVNIDPNRAPSDFSLESYVQLRNLKENF